MARVLETILLGRDQLSPVLTRAAGSVRAYDQAVTQSSARTSAAVEGATRRQTAAMQQVGAAATSAAGSLQAASTRLIAARERESAAAARVSAAEERLAALRASGTASGLRLALAEDNVAQATLAASAAQQRRVTAAAQLNIADRALTAANDQVAAANSRVAATSNSAAASNSRLTGSSAEATVSLRAQQVATNSLAASNGLLGTSMTPLTAGLGAVALGFGYAGYRGMAFDSAMSQVQAATMATGASLDSLRDLAIEAGAATQYSAEEAAQGITELAKAGVSTADILGGGLKGALNLAAAGQLDVAQAAEIAATAMNVFGLSGDQVNHVADLLAAGAGKAQGSVTDMSAALNQSALVANQTGLSIEDTAGALALFASNGLVGSDAGTSFKTMLQSLNPSSAEAAQLMDQLGLRAYNAQGNFVGLEAYAGQLQDALSGLSVEQQNAALKTIFGADAVRAASVIYQAGSEGVREWRNNVNDAGFAAEQASILNDNLRGDLERLGGAFDSAMTSIGSGGQGPLRLLIQELTDVIDTGGDVIGFLQSLPTELVALGAAVAGYLLFGAQLLAQFAALQAWANANLFSPLIVGMANVLTGTVTLTGGLTAARAALVGFLSTAAPFIAVAAISAGVVAILQADRAATDARESIDGLLGPVQNSTSNVERLQAQSNAIAGLREQAETAANALSEYEGRSLLEKIWEWGAPDDPGDALRQAAEESAAALDDQTEAADRADQSIEVLARRYGISRDAVIDFADAHGIDLSGSLQIAQTDFMRLADAAGFAQNTTSAATAAAGSYGALLAEIGSQAQTSADDLQDWLDMLQDVNDGFIQPLSTYTELLAQKEQAERESAQATADATEDSSDSWKDYVQDVSVSLSEYAASLQAQIENQRSWQTNLGIIAQRGGVEVATALAEMGVEGADIVAQMATANETEFTDMATTLAAQAQLAAQSSTQNMANGLQVMAAVGRQGAAATVQSISDELGIGVEQVAAIAAQYGVTLANGVNPVIQALGRQTINLVQTSVGFGALNRAEGGPVWGAGTATSDSIPARLSNGEYVIRASSVEQYGLPALDALNSGRAAGVAYFANGGFVSAADVPQLSSTAPFNTPLSTAAAAAMQVQRDAVIAFLASNAEAIAGSSGGPAGAGAIGGGWQVIAKIVQAAIPQARINSTYRPGDPGYHGRGKAVDFGFGSGPGGAGSAGLASIARLLYTGYGRTLAELIYDGIGDDTPDVKNGQDHSYNAATQREHANHVHAAVYANGGLVRPGSLLNPHVRDQGGDLLPGYTYNGLGRPETVVPTFSPSSMPGYGMQPALSLDNLTITGTLEIGGDGLARIIDGRVENGFRQVRRAILRR